MVGDICNSIAIINCFFSHLLNWIRLIGKFIRIGECSLELYREIAVVAATQAEYGFCKIHISTLTTSHNKFFISAVNKLGYYMK